jgi:hypothetical protein
MGKKGTSIVLGLVVLLAAGFFGYRIYRARQPEASLARLVEACRNSDLEGVRRYLSETDIAAKAVDNLAAEVLPGDQTGKNNPAGQLLNSLGTGLAQAVKPNLAREVTAAVEQAVVGGKLAHLRLGDGPPPSPATADAANVFIGAAVKKDGLAHVPVTYVPEDGRVGVTLDCVMRPVDDHWQVVAIGNLKDVIGKVGFSVLP